MSPFLRSLANRFPRLKELLKNLVLPLIRKHYVSSHYIQIQENDAAREACRLRGAWQSLDMPVRQRELVDAQLEEFRQGRSVDVFDVMVDALRSLPTKVRGMSLLEIGCSSGFYSEVLEIANMGVSYSGCDYSDAFIELARTRYPALRFDVEDATSLNYGNSSFDIVVSGCCLLHIPEYEIAVSETARVTRHYAIFHRTPVVWGKPKVYYRKQAYGVETMEIHFNEAQFLQLLENQGLKLIATYELAPGKICNGETGSANRTYVCRKTDR